jgi:hypothetical protein
MGFPFLGDLNATLTKSIGPQIILNIDSLVK